MSDPVSLQGMLARARGAAPVAAAAARKVFVHTFGCQMNDSDSARMVELLGRHGFAATPHAEDADVILLNTCAVREKAEQKLLSALGRYREVKARRGTLIAVSGCVAQQEKDRLLKRVPYVDFVFGPDHIGRLPELLRRVAALPGILRIRFTTSHPHDLSDALVEAFRDEPKVMPHFHLPVQSGSDAVLARMRRDYGVTAYLERFDRLVRARPGIAITTDFIVGFPGESDADFEGSMALLERARFDQSFSFLFSPRPHTAAALRMNHGPGWEEVPRALAVARLERLQAAQRRIAAENFAAQLGRTVEVLVEGASDESGTQRGRTPENHVVHLAAGEDLAAAGAVVRARITRAGQSSLSGVVV